MLKDEVIKFLNDNGEKLIVGGYANYLDLKRKKISEGTGNELCDY